MSWSKVSRLEREVRDFHECPREIESIDIAYFGDKPYYKIKFRGNRVRYKPIRK